jgi:fibronectin type 3 domain-containing protein
MITVRGLALLLLTVLSAAMAVGCTLIPPAAPTNVAASNGTESGRIQVTWDVDETATSYQVHRTAEEGGTFSQVADVSAPPFDDTVVVEGTVYWYKICGCNSAGCGDLSEPHAGYVRPTPPPPPA